MHMTPPPPGPHPLLPGPQGALPAGQPAAVPERLNREGGGGFVSLSPPPPSTGARSPWVPESPQALSFPHSPRPEPKEQRQKSPQRARCPPGTDRPGAAAKAAAISLHPFPPFPVRGRRNRSFRQRRAAPLQAALLPYPPRPALLPPPLQCRAVRATSRTRVGNSG